MLDLTKPENRCAVGGAEYVAIDGNREPDSCCEKCEGFRALEMCMALKTCTKEDRPDKREIYWRPASEVEGAAPIRDGCRLLWPDDPHQPGDESFVANGWTSDDIGAVLRTAFPRRRKVA